MISQAYKEELMKLGEIVVAKKILIDIFLQQLFSVLRQDFHTMTK